MAQENLKKAINVIDSIVEQGEKSFADGVQGNDIFPILLAGSPASQVDWKAAIAEAKDRTPESNAELVEFIKTDLDLANDTAEQKVETAIAALAAIDNLILAFRKTAA